jgi:hypothetical protein
MTIAERNQACLLAAAAFRDALALMDEALGFDASTELADRDLITIIETLEEKEYVGASGLRY